MISQDSPACRTGSECQGVGLLGPFTLICEIYQKACITMKYLNQFLKFGADPFFAGKVLTVTGIREWLDHETKAKLGWIVDTVITVDDTPYKYKAGAAASNLYEKLALKTPVNPSVSIGESVVPVNPVCTVYGEYRNQLSVRCDNVVAAPAAGKGKV